MPYCPQCKAEYRDGFDTCYDCQVPLVDELSTEPDDEPIIVLPNNCALLTHPVLLTQVETIMEVDYICHHLNEESIPYYFSKDSILPHLAVKYGELPHYYKLYVDENALRQATAILDDISAIQQDARNNDFLL